MPENIAKLPQKFKKKPEPLVLTDDQQQELRLKQMAMKKSENKTSEVERTWAAEYLCLWSADNDKAAALSDYVEKTLKLRIAYVSTFCTFY